MQVVQGKGRGSLRSTNARDITLALAIKLALLTALWALFFRTAAPPASNAAATAAGVAGVACAFAILNAMWFEFDADKYVLEKPADTKNVS
jgi:cyd operon protein YbgT